MKLGPGKMVSVMVVGRVRLVASGFFAAILVWHESAAQVDAQGEATAAFRVAIEGCLANAERFNGYSCTFTIRHGMAASEEEALAQGPTQQVVRATAAMAVDGEKLRYVRASDDRPRYDAQSNTASIAVAPKSILSDGPLTFAMDGIAHAGNIGARRLGVDYTTWNLGGMLNGGDEGNVDDFFARQLQYKAQISALDRTTIVDVQTQPYRIWLPAGHIDAFIDELRGFLPVRVDSVSRDRLFARGYLTELREVDGGWFPIRCVTIWPGADPAGSVTTREVVVTDLLLQKPAADEFKVNVRAGLRLDDGVDPNTAMTIRKDQVVDFKRMHELSEMMQQVALRRESSEREPENGWSLGRWIGGASIASLLVVVTWLLVRRARR